MSDPEGAAQGTSEAGPDTSVAISATFINYSSTTFDLGFWGCILQDGLGSLNQSPGPQLQANDGVQTMSAQQMLSHLETGDYDIFLTWYDPATNARFGVKVWVPFQSIGIGAAPYWYYSYDDEGGADEAPNWIKNSGPSVPYTWPTQIGFDIVGTPQATHTSLFVQVLIQDLPSQ